MNNRILFAVARAAFRSTWKDLVLTDIVYKVIAFVALTPLVGVLFRLFVAWKGDTVLADQDILFFFFSPAGWLCFMLVGILWIAIIALEQTALLGILAARHRRQRIGVIAALRFAILRARPVMLVTARLLVYALLAFAPFLVALGVVYLAFLGRHDINFYLQNKPPAFWGAVGLAGAIMVGFIAVALRLITSWFFALPLVIFNNIAPSQVLAKSRDHAAGHRRALLYWIVLWALASSVLSVAASSLVMVLGRFTVPHATQSLQLMVVVVGAVLAIGALANLAVNLLSTTAFAVLLMTLYREICAPSTLELPHLAVTTVADHGGWKITRGRLIGAAIVGVLVATAVGAGTIQTVQLEDHTEVMAHRGASATAPENTMAAVEQAIADKADWVEIDVQETADGQVVVFHDSDFMKLAGVPLKIWEATAADLKQIDIGSWFDPRFKDQRVPTLSQVLDVCKGKIKVNIELKYYGHNQQLEQKVVNIVEQHDMADQIAVMSLKLDLVNSMKKLRPEWKVGLLMSVSAGDLRKLDADFLAVNAAFADRRFVRSAHQLGKQVFVWTVNDAPTMSLMISRGADSLITDKPALARSVLRQRAELSSPERLLIDLGGMFGVTPALGSP